ncbi:MAG: ABC transporter permease subunit [Bdellovibrionales bacterium]|nr:ABC transporter permease subunit [Bdellovibrionales bacterium]
MKSVWIIAHNTFREIIRDRILYGLIIFALLLIGLSLILGQLSFSEQMRISLDFGFAAIHISAVILSIFIGSTLVFKEIDKKTVMTLLARPITRFQFLIGKALGLVMVIGTVLVGLSAVLLIVLISMGVLVEANFTVGLYGIFLESIVLLSMALMFSTFTRPVMVVSACLGLFLIGHWMGSLEFFAQKSKAQSFIAFERFLSTVIPNLESFNWRSLAIYGDSISTDLLLSASFYSSIWVMIFLVTATLIIWRKDFG